MLPVRVTLNDGLVTVGLGGSECSPKRTLHTPLDIEPQNNRAGSPCQCARGINRTIVDDEHREPEGDRSLDALRDCALLVECRNDGWDCIPISHVGAKDRCHEGPAIP